MKQGAAFLAGITLVVAATPLAAGEPPALPLPTGMTAGASPMSAPVLYGGMPGETTRSSWRDRFSGFSLFGKSDCESRGLVQVKPQWCTDCAPAFRHPLPPLPAGVTTATAAVPVAAREPACSEHHGDCWQKLKAWLCYRQTPVHLPCTPTPRNPPLFTLFPCKENCGAVGAGCDISRKGLLHGKHAQSGCTTCPAPAEQILPGYRFAAPQAPAEPVAPPAPTTSYYRPGR
jgi:hypothetical protein